MRGTAAGTATLLFLAACVGGPAPALQPPTGQAVRPAPGGTTRTFDLVAAPVTLELRPGLTVQAWAYNGTVPGPALRVTEGDLVRVRLHNRLPVGTTIHWHGLAVPNGQDGVAGVTQDPVPPGGSADYAFVATATGTYWYHSHQQAAAQVDRGLYGLLVVEQRAASTAAARDLSLVYDEWPLGLELSSPPGAGDPALAAYVTVAANGRSGAAIEPLRFQPGQPVRLRLLNAGYLVHFVRVDGTAVRIAAFDGHEAASGPATTDALPLGPGERLDLWFEGPATPLWVRLQDAFPPSAEAVVPLLPSASAPPARPSAGAARPVLDLFSYPAQAAPKWPTGAVADRSFTLRLGEVAGRSASPMPGMQMNGVRYEINGQVFPATGTLDVAAGDLVAITFVNEGREDHAMHVHGHAFQLLAREGRPVPGVIVRDTVVVRAHTSVTVGFRASNPGWWMVHCHQLQHSAGGMMVLLRYQGALRLAQLGGPLQAMPD